MSDPPTREVPRMAECDCPADPRIGSFFDRRSRNRRGAGRRFEMGGVSKALLAALIEADPSGKSVLELGCGPGALMVELLAAGAERGTGLDLSPEVIEEARAHATESGLADRVTFAAGDGARADLDAHDWVILDKVMCCYPDVGRLLANSIPAAHRLYAFAVPSSVGWRGAIARVVMWLDKAVTRLSQQPCPGYVHDLAMIEGRLRKAGFHERSRRHRFAWRIAVFERPEGALTAPAGAK